MHDDVGISIPTTGDLTPWAKQGVLLLNAALTVRAGEPNSHAKTGWHQFTDAVIKKVSDEKEGVVFLLWGSFAHQKQELIDQTKHHVLKQRTHHHTALIKVFLVANISAKQMIFWFSKNSNR